MVAVEFPGTKTIVFDLNLMYLLVLRLKIREIEFDHLYSSFDLLKRFHKNIFAT